MRTMEESEIVLSDSTRVSFVLDPASGEVVIYRFITTCCEALFESLLDSNAEAHHAVEDISNDTRRALADFILRFIFEHGSTLSKSGALISKRVTLSSYVVLTNAVNVRMDGSLHLALRCMYTPAFALLVGNKRPSNDLLSEKESLSSHDHQSSSFDLESVEELMSNLLRTICDHKHRIDLLNHCKCVLDQCYIRKSLEKMQGVAFVANGSILPRNYISHSDVVAFVSPESLQQTIELPYHGSISGMVVPLGVTVITGGGFHGKSTLLNAIASGCYDKKPGDGREFVVSIAESTCIRAEDGRSVSNVDISAFIANLPSAASVDPTDFSTSSASGSTSQASNVVEAIEAGSRLFILDEDTCAGNFMIRDSRMRSMIANEPITPFIYRVNNIWNQLGISTVVVIGGSGDWFDVHDTVILLDNYLCKDMTKKAYSISKQFCTGRVTFNGRGLVHQLPWPCLGYCRVLTRKSLDQMRSCLLPSHITVSDDGSKVWHHSDNCKDKVIDLTRIEQRIQHSAVTQGIVQIAYWMLTQAQDEGRDESGMVEWVENFFSTISKEGLTFYDLYTRNGSSEGIHSFDTFLMMPRSQDIIAFVNRMGKEFVFSRKYYNHDVDPEDNNNDDVGEKLINSIQ